MLLPRLKVPWSSSSRTGTVVATGSHHCSEENAASGFTDHRGTESSSDHLKVLVGGLHLMILPL